MNEEGSPNTYTESLTYSEQNIKVVEDNNGDYICHTTCNIDGNNRITQIIDQYEGDHIHTTQCSYTNGYLTQITLSCPQAPQDDWIQNNHWEDGKITTSEVLDQTTMETMENVTLKYSANSDSYKYPMSAYLLFETELMSLAYLPESYLGTKTNGIPIETIEYDTNSRHTYRCTYTIEADEDGYITKLTDTSIETDETGNVIGREVGSITFIYEEVVTK